VEDAISSLNGRANVENQSKENFIVLSYGQSGEMQWHLMLQLDPFQVYFFRGNDNDVPPMIIAGTGGLTHFEIRRNKNCSGGNEVGIGKRKLSDFDVDLGDDAADNDEDVEGRHGGKKVVGYWEDGLAIYADGTREERREIESTHADDGTTDVTVDAHVGETQDQRRLDEEHFDTKDMWEEKFGDHTDSKPHGPMSVGLELTFPASTHLFGLPEHASSTRLKTTAGSEHYYSEPYRLYNLDVFEYELDETMALYGHIPLVVSQSMRTGTAGAFWFNPTETFVDVEEAAGSSKTHFMSESGIVDLFLLPGPDPAAMYEQYGRITGRMSLPPIFALGYHQCRWNYRDEADVYHVHSKFEELDYPYDVLWLDIEHTDGKRYFTWDDKAFPNPVEMQKKLGGHGRRMVTIIDPHIKRDNNYYIHKEATSLGLYINDKNGNNDFDGWCWPGSSSYLDFTSEKVRSWWGEQFGYDKYKGSTPELFTWNDMNEPSVFNGPEVSMQKDLLNLNKIEHREWHNLYGMLFHRSTSEGLIKRNEGDNVRPFVLSRSFFAGSQRYGAIWTGDNEAKWSHLEIAAPMLLGLNVGALSFVGADVGGFFGNTDAELMTRWMQAGAYQPFFRGHAHHDAKRREPWMFGDETMVRLRRAAMARYALLPYWYTVFWQASVTGMPVMR
jgi:alpha 1,3-glucosidase